MLRTSIFIISFVVSSMLSVNAAAQSTENNFVDIEKALKTGDAESFSNLFCELIDIDILGDANIYSKNQAKQIVKKFFTKYTPKNFTFIHQSGKGKVQYGIGRLSAGGENFRVTIFLQDLGNKYAIHQIRIEKN